MEDLYRHRISLSGGQKRKLRLAFKKRRAAVVGLTYSNIKSGEDHILLTKEQHKAVDRAARNNRGVRLLIHYEQLLKNKEGGLLNEMLGFVETNVPGGKRFISPLVRNKLAPLLKNKFVPWLKSLIDKELDTIIATKGSGLKRRINKKLNSYFEI